MALEKKRLNKLLVFRLILAWTFWTLFFFPLLFLPRRLQYGIFWRIFSSLFLWANKVRVRYTSDIDINNLKEPVIFSPNHKAYFDAHSIARLLKKPFSIVYNATMDKNIFYRIVARKMGMVPIKRETHFSQKNSFEKVYKLLKKRYSIIMFPEGWHIEGDEIAKFRRGIAKIAKDTKVSVMPMAIYGVDDSLRYAKKLTWKTVYIKTSAPIKYEDYNDDKLFLEDLRRRVVELYNSLKNEYKN